MSGLDRQDLEILGYYAKNGNRELYWNYLAQAQGNDGYGLLALGVVRNDNAPGQVANLYADMRARDDGRVMRDSDWERFGVDLVKNDLQLRRTYVDDGRADLALNLPARDVQAAHDQSFRNAQIDPNAWTPRVLLEAARNGRGEVEAERIWSHMLDNDWRGAERMGQTVNDIRRNMPAGEAAGYTARLGLVRAMAATSGYSNTDPDTIGGHPLTYRYDRNDRSWSQISSGGGMSDVRGVREPRLLEQLEDARSVRLHRETLRTDFHPSDPNRNRPIMASPWLIADGGTLGSPEQAYAQADTQRPAQHGGIMTKPTIDTPFQEGTNHPLYQQAFAAVSRRDAELGRAPDENGHKIAVAGAGLAARGGYARIDDIVFNVATDKVGAGERFFVLQGGRDDPARLRESMPTRDALAMTPQQVEQQLAQLGVQQAQSLQPAQRDPLQREPSGQQLA